MARFGITKPLGNIKPEHVFDAAQVAFKNIGWEVYKMRSIAFLVEARVSGEQGYVLANLIASRLTVVYGAGFLSGPAPVFRMDW